ncbi:LysR family transcriptional regulator [Kutzneria viridogrisea]|uniref:HTH lysR-type domain-containing protein n=2 Tax=Kutzneria TaxID=43356 RepID=W5WFL6_9PSEU|nr:LysR family transcriptional regulator [Kutzneria albida]AHH99391.1 hypothetical protein KALB_6031 [Kutzneria albida DSM 43870]MBA8923053.1 DNA-binding transcriptional LysR family regulator [Kutzneria viridogrisea]
MQLEVHHLRLVQAIAESGTLSRAATALGVTQPAVSAQLKRLERMLDCRLFDRTENAAVPTPMGELLLRRTAAVLPLMEHLIEEVEPCTVAARAPQVLRVGAVCSAIVPHLPTVVATACPGSTPSVLNDDCCATLLGLLAQNRLDLALYKEYPGFEQEVPDGVDTALVIEEPTFVQLARDHPLASRATVTLADLRAERWALPPVSSARFHEYFNDACARSGFTPILDQTATEVVVLMAVRCGAVGLIQPACEESRDVVVRSLAGDTLPRRHLLAWRRNSFMATHWRAMLDAAIEGYWTEAALSEVYRRYLPLIR